MERLLTELGVWSYLIIFVAKIIEVAMATVRIMFVAKGEKIKASIIAFIEVGMWIVIVSAVLTGINEDPIRAVVYCAAFASGNYVGITIESKLALGLSSVQAIIKEGSGKELIESLRENGFGLTIIKGEGKENKKEILLIHLKRRKIKEAVEIIKSNKEDAVIIINEVKSVSGGFMKK